MSAIAPPLPRPARPRTAPPAAPAPPAPAVGGETRVLLDGISWESYLRLREELDAAGDRTRLTYDCGQLEIEVLGYDHEGIAGFVGRLVEEYATGLAIDIKSAGSTTLSSKSAQKGLEGDQSYHIANALRMRGKKKLDLAVDPPPDLVIEVDITSPSIRKMPIYAALGVPELWRWRGGLLTFWTLDGGEYAEVENSGTFPELTKAVIERHLAMRDDLGETQTILAFRQWIAALPRPAGAGA